jgi:hypothetical protein
VKTLRRRSVALPNRDAAAYRGTRLRIPQLPTAAPD